MGLPMERVELLLSELSIAGPADAGG